jgi:hypothetical protein
MALFEAEKKQI